MITSVRTTIAVLLLAGLGTAADSPIFRVERLSDRVLLLTENGLMENIVVALKSQKGLVIVDTFGSPVTAAAARETVEAAFGRRDFIYVVNTHPHWDHSWGNQVFPQATVAGFQGPKTNAEEVTRGAAQMAARMRQQLPEIEQRLQSASSTARPAIEHELAWRRRLVSGLESGFRPGPPALTFTDRMTLDLGDLTLNLVFFGRAHSGQDILVHVPEEKLLLTGDVFLDRGWMPLFCGQDELDVPRWIAALDSLLAQDLKTIVPAHRGPWTPAKLALWRNYIADLWSGVQTAKQAGQDLEGAKKLLPPPSPIFYLKDLGHSEADIRSFHDRNLQAFWRQR